MTTIRDRGKAIRTFIVENLDKHSTDIARMAAQKFECSRQAVHKHLHKLVEEGVLSAEGRTRNKVYRLAPLVTWEKTYPLAGLAEDGVWRDDISSVLGKLSDNAMAIWQYGFTEMLNNAIDHSGGSAVTVKLEKTAAATRIFVLDDGVGIFKKIQGALSLADERHAVLEIAKGKCTTDPANHSGEGIFFSSRMFDEFLILSHGVFFSHKFGEDEDGIMQLPSPAKGTGVLMRLHNHTSRSDRKVFDQFTSGEGYGFTKTVVPVELMRYGDDNLISRSQAKRPLARFDRFAVVVLDFSGVAMIGQAFADEVFRVFRRKHPEVELRVHKANAEVRRMISRVDAASPAT